MRLQTPTIDNRTPRDIAFACILKSRPLSEAELIERYNKQCEKLHVLPLWGQLRTALQALKTAGKIKLENGKVIRA